jgi:spore germination protein GerM
MKKIFLIIILIFLLGLLTYFYFPKQNHLENKEVFCPQDVKLCSDGSYVSRIPPNCDFNKCPKEDLIVVENPKAEEEIKPILFSKNQFREVTLYYYNPNLDKDEEGNILCSHKGLVGIKRKIPVSQTPIKDTINLLLKGKENLVGDEINNLQTEFPLEGFELKSLNLKEDGVLILEFNDPLNKTTGGSCRVQILRSQIEKTAKQFQGVKEVKFYPEYLFQP